MLEDDGDRLYALRTVGERCAIGDREIWCIFDRAFFDVAADAIDVEDTGPRLYCRATDVADLGIKKGTEINRLADNSAYHVQRIEPDGTGMVLIRLAG